MFGDVLQQAAQLDGITLLDEIGPIQLFSERFVASLAAVFAQPPALNMIATIHQTDERLAPYRTADGVALIEVTAANREVMPEMLQTAIKHLNIIQRLTPLQLRCFNMLFKGYAEEAQLLQAKKLTGNAVQYVVEQAVSAEADTRWLVKGHHGDYAVRLNHDAYSCDCPLYRAAGIYAGRPGECSHIQSVKLFTS